MKVNHNYSRSKQKLYAVLRIRLSKTPNVIVNGLYYEADTMDILNGVCH